MCDCDVAGPLLSKADDSRVDEAVYPSVCTKSHLPHLVVSIHLVLHPACRDNNCTR